MHPDILSAVANERLADQRRRLRHRAARRERAAAAPTGPRDNGRPGGGTPAPPPRPEPAVPTAAPEAVPAAGRG